MSKGDRNQGDKGKVKFRFIEFELDGSDSTLQESLRNIASAIGRSGPGQSYRLVPATSAKKPALVDGGGPPEPELEADLVEETTEAESSVADETTNGSSRPRGPRTFKAPKILDDLDVINVNPSLRDFCQAKAPDGEWKRYLVIAAWLKEHAKVDEVTIDHIYTCYRAMGWHPPRDVSQPLRDMKNKQGWFSKGKAKGAYAINHVGLGEVGRMASPNN